MFPLLGNFVPMSGIPKMNVTPYIHALVYHAPDILKKYGNIKKFSGQGVEKNNDDAKRNYFSSNLQDPCEVEGRLEITVTSFSYFNKICSRAKRDLYICFFPTLCCIYFLSSSVQQLISNTIKNDLSRVHIRQILSFNQSLLGLMTMNVHLFFSSPAHKIPLQYTIFRAWEPKTVTVCHHLCNTRLQTGQHQQDKELYSRLSVLGE